MRVGLETETTFGRDVRQVLTASQVGLSFSDNVGPVVEFEYLNADAPYELALPGLRQAPSEVVVRRAQSQTTGRVESGCRVEWSWVNGGLTVHSVDVVNTGETYDVTLGVWRG